MEPAVKHICKFFQTQGRDGDVYALWVISSPLMVHVNFPKTEGLMSYDLYFANKSPSSDRSSYPSS